MVRYSANLKGDVSEEITQDWQRVTLEAELPDVFDHVEVGFNGQGGRGVGVGQKSRH
mgnify:CR=1 FL=1